MLWSLLLFAFPGAVFAETLTLRAAVREALDRSAEVAAASAEAEQAGLEEPLLLSNTDPKLLAGYRRVDDRSPRALPAFEGSRAQIDEWNAALAATTLLGTEARLNFENERLVNPTPFRVIDPSVKSKLNLEVRQRLVRYFWGRPDKARRGRARQGQAAAQLRLRGARERAAAAAARAFIELRFALGQRAIKAEGVEDARRLLAKYEEKRRYGLAEESDVLQARASLELQEVELLQADALAARARHALAAALFRPDAGKLPEELGPVEGVPAPAEVADEEALSRRADVASARAFVAASEWESRIAVLDTLPDLTLSASWGAAGLASRYGESWRDLRSFDHPVTAAGLALEVPFGFRKERLTRRQARLKLAAAKAEAARVETEARRELRDAQETLALARRRVEAGRRLLELERRKFAAEEANFRKGRSTTDLLLRFHQDIRRAEIEVLRAELDEAFARVALAASTGSLLEGWP